MLKDCADFLWFILMILKIFSDSVSDHDHIRKVLEAV